MAACLDVGVPEGERGGGEAVKVWRAGGIPRQTDRAHKTTFIATENRVPQVWMLRSIGSPKVTQYSCARTVVGPVQSIYTYSTEGGEKDE